MLLWFVCGTIYAQKHNLKTEVLVYIMPDSLELPVHEKGKLSLLHANVKSFALATKLKKVNATDIAKAFPVWKDKDSIVTRNDGEQVQMPPFHRIFTLTFNSEAGADSAISILKQSKAVIFAEKNTEPTLDNDPYYLTDTQWYLKNVGRNLGTAGADINAEGAWAIYTGSSNSKIAIIDSGVELTHEDLSGKATGDTPFGDTHGTMVAGIAAAKANNMLGIRGVDWNAQIISKNVYDANGNYIGDAAVSQKIIDAVSEGANVLNRSSSSPVNSSTLAMAYAYAYKMNRITVASMGNDGIQEVRYPAALPNVIAVGNTKNDDFISNFSNTGNYIDVVAPGENIFSTTIGNTYGFNTGTSFSTPQVSGLASLLKGFKPNLANDDIRQIIRLSADDKGVPGYDSIYGYGRINAGRALSYLNSPYALRQTKAKSGTIINTSPSQYLSLFISASGLATGNYLVKKVEVQKTVALPENIYKVVGAWGLGVLTTGWRDGGTINFGEGYCEVVPGSLTSTSVTLRTNVYQIWNIGGSYLGYYPTEPSNVTFAYSALGFEKPSISGPTHACPGEDMTFTLSNFPAGSTVEWSQDTPLIRVSPQGSNPCTFKCPNITHGQISASVNIGTYNTTLTQDVNVGMGYYNYSDFSIQVYETSTGHLINAEGPECLCENQTYDLVVTNNGSTQVSNYTWSVPWTIISSDGNTIRINTGSNTEASIGVSATNPCGYEENIAGTNLLPGFYCGGGYSLSPNPTSDAVTITLNQPASTSTSALTATSAISKNEATSYSVKVIDSFSTIVYTGTKTSNQFTIPTVTLRNGIYTVIVSDGTRSYQQKLIVKH